MSDALDGLNVTHHELVRDGVSLHYVSAGEGPLVVLAHGFPDTWYTWHRQIPVLVAAGFRVVAPTLRGYGPSGRPTEVSAYGVRHLADDLAGIIRACGAERASVVGHDWGAAAAWGFAMRHPELLDRLVIENVPHPVVFSQALYSPALHLRAPHFLLFQVPWLPERTLAANDYALLRWIWRFGCVAPGTYGPALQQHTLAALGTMDRLGAAMAFYRAAAQHPREGVKPVPIPHPVLMLMGAKDPAIAPGMGPTPAHYLPNVRLEVLPDVGHWCHLERPDHVNEALLAFLKPEGDPVRV